MNTQYRKDYSHTQHTYQYLEYLGMDKDHVSSVMEKYERITDNRGMILCDPKSIFMEELLVFVRYICPIPRVNTTTSDEIEDETRTIEENMERFTTKLCQFLHIIPSHKHHYEGFSSSVSVSALNDKTAEEQTTFFQYIFGLFRRFEQGMPDELLDTVRHMTRLRCDIQ